MNKETFIEYIYQRHSGNVKLGLERMFSILSEMGNPHQKLTGIHIAGTNGKGSCAAMCEKLGLFHGLHTGLNTSPHLVEYNERIRIDGIPVNYSELMEVYHLWEAIFEENEASFFEISTAFAFYLFDKKKLDLSIFEVGLGGRLDGTNPFQSDVTAITSISYDHPISLGESIEEIAFEKAGILKPNVPVVIGNMPETASTVIKKRAIETHSPVYQINNHFFVENIRFDHKGTTFDYRFQDLNFPNISVNLLGRHQALNAAVALTCFILFMQKMNKEVDNELIYQAFQNIQWQGRMQILQNEPLVIIDGAHNEEGISVLVENLTAFFPEKKIIFVTAILRDKKIDKIMRLLCSNCKQIIISKNKSTRAAEISEQIDFAKLYTENYLPYEDVNEALQYAIRHAEKEDVIVVCGSLYTIAEVLDNDYYRNLTSLKK